MHQTIVCCDQDKCKNYLVVLICDICKRNQNRRIDNFEKLEPGTITTSGVWYTYETDENGRVYRNFKE
jgi:hypothetical protein